MAKLIISDKTRQERFEIKGNYTDLQLAQIAATYYLGLWYCHDLHGTDQLSEIDRAEGRNRKRNWEKERDFLRTEVYQTAMAILLETHHFCADVSHAFDAAFEADIEEV